MPEVVVYTKPGADDQFAEDAEFAALASGLPATIATGAPVAAVPLVPSPSQFTPAAVSAAGGRYPAWLSDDGTRLFATLRSTFRWSDDEGVTWDDGFDFDTVHSGASITAVRETPAGEMLVATGLPDSGSVKGRLYLSSGYAANPATSSWTMVQEMANVGTYCAPQYGGIWVDDECILVNEYGPKNGATAARYTYLSEDNGATWRVIFDRLTTVDSVTTGLHMHGVAYDQWWDRVWVSFGDDTSGLYYSDNWRETTPTWTACDYTAVVGGPYQSVAIFPMEKCILLMSDGTPNGINRVMRVDSTGASTMANPKVESAYRIDNLTTLTWLGQQPFQAKHVADAPVLLPFGTDATATAQAAKLLITYDGMTITEVWQDTAPPLSAANSGLKAMVGPTVPNDLLMGYLDDGRNVGDYTKIKGPAPLLAKSRPAPRALLAQGQADWLHPGLTRSVYADHLMMPTGPILAVQAASVNTANQSRGALVRAPRRGRLRKLHIYVAVQSGNIEVTVYRLTNPRERVYSSGSIACPGTGWQQIVDDTGVLVEAGDQFIFHVVTSDATASLAKVGQGTGAFTVLPSALNETTSGASLKLLEAYTSTGPGTMPTTIAEGSVASSITSAPFVIGRIE